MKQEGIIHYASDPRTWHRAKLHCRAEKYSISTLVLALLKDFLNAIEEDDSLKEVVVQRTDQQVLEDHGQLRLHLGD